VHRAFSDVGGHVVLGSPKSHQSRTVPLPPFLARELAAALAGRKPDDLAFTIPRRRSWGTPASRPRSTCTGISTLATWTATPTASETRPRLLIRPKSGQMSRTATLAPRTQGDELGYMSALGGTRTPNLLIRSQMLYPLSYERGCASQSTVRRAASVLG
jgi:hypothetical protein